MHTDRLREILNHLNMAVEDLSMLLDQQSDTTETTTPVTEQPAVGESDRYSWFNIELRQRFPDTEEAPPNSVDMVFSIADNNRQWISDVLDIALDYHNTKYAVGKPIGFTISALKKGSPEQAAEQVKGIKKYQQTSGNSLVDSALEEARKRIKEPVPEPRHSRLRQLKEENERQ